MSLPELGWNDEAPYSRSQRSFMLFIPMHPGMKSVPSRDFPYCTRVDISRTFSRGNKRRFETTSCRKREAREGGGLQFFDSFQFVKANSQKTSRQEIISIRFQTFVNDWGPSIPENPSNTQHVTSSSVYIGMKLNLISSKDLSKTSFAGIELKEATKH